MSERETNTHTHSHRQNERERHTKIVRDIRSERDTHTQRDKWDKHTDRMRETYKDIVIESTRETFNV